VKVPTRSDRERGGVLTVNELGTQLHWDREIGKVQREYPPADAAARFEEADPLSCPRQRPRRRESRGTGTDDGYVVSGHIRARCG
jgi:hypothetical protein